MCVELLILSYFSGTKLRVAVGVSRVELCDIFLYTFSFTFGIRQC